AGLSLVLAGGPCIAVALVVAFHLTVPYVTNRHVIQLEVAVAMAATLAALAVALPLAFVLGRALEAGLARLAPRVPALASVWAPFVALAALAVTALAVWAARNWETARQLPLRPPVVLAVGVALALASLGPAHALVARLGAIARWPRRAGWAALPFVLLGLVLAPGGSAPVSKAA